AERRTHGKFLLIPGFMARTYAVAAGDRALFRRTLQRVRDTPEDIDPDERLPNLLARRRAVRDLQQENRFFTARLAPAPTHPRTETDRSRPHRTARHALVRRRDAGQ